MRNGLHFSSLSFRIFTVVLFASGFFNTYSQDAVMRSGKQLEKKDFKENSLRYMDFVNNRGRLSTSSVIFSPDKEAMIGFSADRKETYNFIVFQDYINFKEIREISAEVPNEAVVTLNALVRIKDKNFLIYSQYTKRNKQTAVYLNEMSNTNILLGSPLKIMTIGEEKNAVYGDINVQASKNKKSILIYQTTEGSGKDTRRISCFVMDQNFSEVWHNDFDFKLTEKEASLNSVDVDDDGNLYVLVYKGKEKVQKTAVFSYFWKNKKFKETPIGNADEKAKNYGCLLKIVDGVNPVVAGVTDANDDLNYFVVSFDPAKNSSRELVSAKFPEKAKKALVNKNVEELYLAVKHIVKTTNGNFVLSFEENHEVTHSSNTYTSSYSSYFSAGIFIISVGANGITWSNIINKKQYVASPFITSHALIAEGDNIYVFYNDRDSNVGKDGGDSKTYQGVNTVLMMQKINPSGDMTSQQIPTGQPDTFGINPNYFVKITDKLYHTQLFAITFSKYACSYATVEVK